MSRLTDLLAQLGGIGRNEDNSITRLGFSREYFSALEAVKAQMELLGMQTEVDPVGNLRGLLPGADPDSSSIVLGSHMDTVIRGGLFDGMLGVAGGLEMVYRLKEQGTALRHNLELWGFNQEESSPLGGTFGSRSVVGMLDPDRPGYPEKLAQYGLSPDKIRAARRDVSKYACYLEYHIEQGDKLDALGIDIGVVSGIVSIIRYTVTAHGVSNHAGTTMMPSRKDALVGMSKLIVAAEERARQLDDSLVFTVGTLSVSPGQENVIPNHAVACFEMRHMEKAVTDRFYQDIRDLAGGISNCTFTFENTEAKYATPCASHLIETIRQVCCDLGVNHIVMPSGAGHDANPFAHAGVPIGMVFVPSIGGISHHGSEQTQPHHVDLGADVLLQTILELDKKLP